MKVTAEVALALAMSCASGLALAQSGAVHEPAGSGTGVATARCAYTDSDAQCSSPAAPQFPRRAPGPPPYPPPPPQYRVHAAPGPALKGALIGGLIGFGFGAAPGGNRSTQARLGLGAWVGFIGAGIGAAIAADHASYRYHYRYRHAPWPYEDEDEMSSRKPTRPRSASEAYARSSPQGSTSPEISQKTTPEGTGTAHPASDK